MLVSREIVRQQILCDLSCLPGDLAIKPDVLTTDAPGEFPPGLGGHGRVALLPGVLAGSGRDSQRGDPELHRFSCPGPFSVAG